MYFSICRRLRSHILSLSLSPYFFRHVGTLRAFIYSPLKDFELKVFVVVVVATVSRLAGRADALVYTTDCIGISRDAKKGPSSRVERERPSERERELKKPG